MEVMSVFTHVDASPVLTVHIRPGNRVAVCCAVDWGGGAHYPHDPGLAAVMGLPAAVRPPDAVGLPGVVGLTGAVGMPGEPWHLVRCRQPDVG